MRRLFMVCVVALLYHLPSPAFADPGKLDLMLRTFVSHPTTAKAVFGKAIKSGPGGDRIQVLLKTSDADQTEEAIIRAGGVVVTVIDDIISAWVPLGRLSSLAQQSHVLYIEAPHPMRALNDSAKMLSGVTAVQQANSRRKGKHVIAAVMDGPLDFTHPDFQQADGKSRVQFMTMTDDNGNIGSCVKSEIDAGTCAIQTRGSGTSHGTHVMGIFAGGNPRVSTYQGVCSECDVAFATFRPPRESYATNIVTSAMYSTTMLDNANRFRQLRDILNKPVVINISLGTGFGARDGSDLVSQGLTNVCDNGELPGCAIVAAAGNENDYLGQGFGGIHAGVRVAGGIGRYWAYRAFDPPTPLVSGGSFVEVWLNRESNCTVEFAASRSQTQDPDAPLANRNETIRIAPFQITADTQQPTMVTDGQIRLFAAVDAEDANNGKRHVQLSVFASERIIQQVNQMLLDSSLSPEQFQQRLRQELAPLVGYHYHVKMRTPQGGKCEGDMWLAPDFPTIHSFRSQGEIFQGLQFAAGDSAKTITIPGTTPAVITVGSYLGSKPANGSEACWIASDGSRQCQNVDRNGQVTNQVGRVSLFSSRGPTGSDYPKPDIVAPGEPIISTLARDPTEKDTQDVTRKVKEGDAEYLVLQGTSMASPHIAGIVSLLFAHNRTLTMNQVKEILKRTSVPIAGTSSVEQGAGKVNFEAALREAGAENQSILNGTGNLSRSAANEIIATAGSGSTVIGTGSSPFSRQTANSGGGGCSLINTGE